MREASSFSLASGQSSTRIGVGIDDAQAPTLPLSENRFSSGGPVAGPMRVAGTFSRVPLEGVSGVPVLILVTLLI